jgi:hypothetical protein
MTPREFGMSEYDPARDGPYGDWLRNKGVRANFGGLSRTERVIGEGTVPRGEHAGERFKTIQDELGNRVRERSAEMGVSTGQDVVIRAPKLHISMTATEERQ